WCSALARLVTSRIWYWHSSAVHYPGCLDFHCLGLINRRYCPTGSYTSFDKLIVGHAGCNRRCSLSRSEFRRQHGDRLFTFSITWKWPTIRASEWNFCRWCVPHLGIVGNCFESGHYTLV